ncbi:MAG: hypothetical protein ACPLXC_00495 [Candidatus Pacearchaeota archaeon]
MENLSIDSLKNFFSEFLEQYKQEVEKNYTKERDKLTLFNSFPVRVDLLCDQNLHYSAILLSKNSKPFSEFVVDTTFQDPMMVVAMANSKRFQYGEEKKFLYLLHTNSKIFPKWHPETFAKEFINFEISKNNLK